MSEPVSDPEQRPEQYHPEQHREERDAWWLRAQMVRLMLSITLSMGFLLGVLYRGLGGPAGFMAPIALALSGGFWLFLRPSRGRR